MNHVKFPVAYWQDNQGIVYARTVSGTYACAADSELKKCLQQIKSAITWQSENTHVTKPEYDSPSVETLTVDVRTAESTGDRSWPSKRSIQLQIPCVWGMRDDEAVVCNLLTLDIEFHCDSVHLFREMAIEQAQAKLNGSSQSALQSYLPVDNINTTTLNIAIGESKDRSEQLGHEALEAVASPLTGRAVKQQFNQPWCRENEVAHLAKQLSLPQGNILLVGPRGVGKSTILMWAAKKVLRDKREQLKNNERTSSNQNQKSIMPPVWISSADRIVAGMRYLGQWEQRTENAISELAEFQGILCFERLDGVLKFGGEDASSSVAAFIAPYLENRELRVVIEATREELDRCRTLLPGFENLFQIVEIDPLSEQDCQQVLQQLSNDFGRNHRIGVDPRAANLCLRLFRRFLPYDTFPGQCVGFWKKLLEEARRNRYKTITGDRVVTAFMDLTGLPELLIRDQVRLSVDDVGAWFQNRIIGQKEACQSLTNVVAALKAGLNDPQKPAGVMLFCGPTGVGKTEAAKALTEFMFGNSNPSPTATNRRSLVQERLVRLDMSEYASFGAGQRLILQNDGQPSDLIRRLRQQPFSIVLLDEIEKAADEVFDVLMSLLDEGRLTDRWGRVTDFRSSVVIMTSNLGVHSKEAAGFLSDPEPGFETSVKKFFRPEFFNRIDRIVPFRPLEQKSIAAITELELRNVAERDGLQSRGLQLIWNEEVVQFLVSRGYSKKLGARPLQRTIERLVSVPLAKILSQQTKIASDKINLNVAGNLLEVIPE